MRFSEFSGKEIVNLESGERMGYVGQTDLEINPDTGQILAMVLPAMRWFGFGKRRDDVVIPWDSIRKIGTDMIIVELREKVRGV